MLMEKMKQESIKNRTLMALVLLVQWSNKYEGREDLLFGYALQHSRSGPGEGSTFGKGPKLSYLGETSGSKDPLITNQRQRLEGLSGFVGEREQGFVYTQLSERPFKLATQDKAADGSQKSSVMASKDKSLHPKLTVPKGNPSTSPLSEVQLEKLATIVAEKMKERLVQQGYSVSESSLKKIALEQLAHCRSEQNIIALGQRLKNKNIHFISYLIEEQTRLAQLKTDPSGYQPVFVPAIPVFWQGVMALVSLGVVCYQSQQKMGDSSEVSMGIGEKIREVLGGWSIDGGRTEYPIEEGEIWITEFPNESGQKTRPYDTPMPKQLSTSTERPMVESDGRDSVYEGSSKPPEPILYMFKAKEGGDTSVNEKRIYQPSPKHVVKGKHKGYGSSDPIPTIEIGQKLLDNAYTDPSVKQVYNIYQGKIVKFQPENTGVWHAYEIRPGGNPSVSDQIPDAVLDHMYESGLISKPKLGKLKRNK